MNTNNTSKKYLILLPVYNEQDSLEEIIHQLEKYRDVSDILVIDDGSEDRTPGLLSKMKEIEVIRHESNYGYGAALIEGFQYAIEKEYEYVITIDSDKQHQPDEIEKFMRMNEKTHFDIISGSRYLFTSEEHFKKAPDDRRKVNMRITREINNITGYELTDSFCGFKLYKVEALKRLNLTEQGYGMPLQLWLQACWNELAVKEIPVELIYFDRNKGVSNSFVNVCERYKYYLKIIEKELNNHEDISTRSAS